MPTPAGTGLTRRSMLLQASGLALTIFGAQALAPNAFEDGIASAAAAAPDAPILVSIYMPGGVDTLSVLAPVSDPRYISLRPNLKIAPNSDPNAAFADDDRLQWHTSAHPFAQLHREGKVTVMPSIGWSSSHGSHFTSRHYWEVGELNPQGRVGWLGRYLDRDGSPDNPLQGLSLETYLAPALASASAPVAAASAPQAYSIGYNFVGYRSLIDGGHAAYRRLGTGAAGEDDALHSARRAAGGLGTLAGQLTPLQGKNEPFQQAVPYPSNLHFSSHLAVLAEMIDLGLPLRCVALQANGGYDTHSDQRASLPRDLAGAAASIYAFQRDIEARGLADRVLIHVWSEFGRRVQENGSGTDHGAAGLSMVIGTRASGEMIGEYPGVNVLDSLGNLRSTSDFRGVYCSLLEQWLGVDADGIIPGASGFARPQLVRAA